MAGRRRSAEWDTTPPYGVASLLEMALFDRRRETVRSGRGRRIDVLRVQLDADGAAARHDDTQFEPVSMFHSDILPDQRRYPIDDPASIECVHGVGQSQPRPNRRKNFPATDNWPL